MKNIFSRYLNKFVLVFIENILVYSNIKEEHEEHLCIVLHVLREHQIYTKLSQSYFYKPWIQYLGHLTFDKGIYVDLEKVKAIKDQDTATSVTDIRFFLGLSGYYPNLINNFLTISCPMTTFQNKEHKFSWTTKCEEIFQNLKHLLTIAPIL